MRSQQIAAVSVSPTGCRLWLEIWGSGMTGKPGRAWVVHGGWGFTNDVLVLYGMN